MIVSRKQARDRRVAASGGVPQDDRRRRREHPHRWRARSPYRLKRRYESTSYRSHRTFLPDWHGGQTWHHANLPPVADEQNVAVTGVSVCRVWDTASLLLVLLVFPQEIASYRVMNLRARIPAYLKGDERIRLCVRCIADGVGANVKSVYDEIRYLSYPPRAQISGLFRERGVCNGCLNKRQVYSIVLQ